jgi:hypothetical protein
MRFSAVSFSESEIVPLPTWRDMFFSIAAMALSSCSLPTSTRYTS